MQADMKAKQDDGNCDLDDYEIMEQVLGESRGWTRGVGPRLPKSAFYEPGSSSSSQPTFTADQVRSMFAEYTAPLWQKMEMQPPALNFPNPNDGDDDDGEDDGSEEDDSEDDEGSSSDS